jgi:hypothetical protein
MGKVGKGREEKEERKREEGGKKRETGIREVEKRRGRGKGRREEEEIREKIIEVEKGREGKGREGKGEMEVGKIKREERGMYEGLELTKREKKERVGERENRR